MIKRDYLWIASPHFEHRKVSDEERVRLTLMNKTVVNARGCWEWIGSKRNGYGLVNRGNKTLSAHRVAYAAFKGEEIPGGFVVRHTCDNPSCINPAHLVLGTQADNVADREARGRRDVKGEQIGTAKLTEADVLEIRVSELPAIELAKKYGVHKSNIWAIKSKKSWSHVMEANHGR